MEDPIVQEAGTHLKLVADALLEGGFSEEARKELVGGAFATAFSGNSEETEFFYEVESAHGYRLAAGLAIPASEDPENPRCVEAKVRIVSGKGDAPSLEFVRRTGDTRWTVRALGTLSLPNGHPLGDLAHGERHLNLEPNRMSYELDDRDAFRGIMKAARIFERDEL